MILGCLVGRIEELEWFTSIFAERVAAVMLKAKKGLSDLKFFMTCLPLADFGTFMHGRIGAFLVDV